MMSQQTIGHRDVDMCALAGALRGQKRDQQCRQRGQRAPEQVPDLQDRLDHRVVQLLRQDGQHTGELRSAATD